MNIQTETTSNNHAITLTKVAADYKLQSIAESFLLSGRSNPREPLKPYYHVIKTGELPALPAISGEGVTPMLQSALAKLFAEAGSSYLKDRAATLTPGSSLVLHLAASDIVTAVLAAGLGERTAISGEDIELTYCGSAAFTALAAVWSWSPVSVLKVTAALKAYAAPAHKKSPEDAAILLNRLEPMSKLLTASDAAGSTAAGVELQLIHRTLLTKLTRDAAAIKEELADSI